MHGISMCPRPHDLHSIKHTRVVGQKRSHALARVAKSTSPYVYVLALACELTRPPPTRSPVSAVEISPPDMPNCSESCSSALSCPRATGERHRRDSRHAYPRLLRLAPLATKSHRCHVWRACCTCAIASALWNSRLTVKDGLASTGFFPVVGQTGLPTTMLETLHAWTDQFSGGSPWRRLGRRRTMQIMHLC